jgi:hypothetical protein
LLPFDLTCGLSLYINMPDAFVEFGDEIDDWAN